LARNEQKSQPLDKLQQLRDENARLKALLTSRGIAWRKATAVAPKFSATESGTINTQFTTADKIALFRRLFRGRTDVYPLRWESANGTSGCSPAYGNKWKPSICRKPKVKCGNFVDRDKIRIAFSWVYQAFGWGRGR